MAEQKLELIVEIDEKGAIKGIKNVETATVSAGKEGTKAGKDMDSAWGSVKATMIAAAAVIGGVVVKALGDLTKQGIEFLDLQDDFESVFRGLSGSASEARDRLVTSFGLSTEAATKMLSSVGILTQNMGFSTKASLEFSESIVGLSDAWEKYNPKGIKAEEITQSMTMALAGNYRGLRTLGIVLDDNVVKQTALSKGIIGANEEMNNQQKAQAILAAITDRSTEALKGQKIENASLADQAARSVNFIKDIKTAVGVELAEAFSGSIKTISGVGMSLDNMRKIVSPIISLLKALGQTMVLSVTIPGAIVVNMVKGVVQTVMEMGNAIEKIKEGKVKEAAAGLAGAVGKGFKDTLMAPIEVLKSAGASYLETFDKIIHPIEVKRKQNDEKELAEHDKQTAKLAAIDDAGGEAAKARAKKQAEDLKLIKEASYKNDLDRDLGHLNDQYEAAIEAAQREGKDVTAIMNAYDSQKAEILKKDADRQKELADKEFERRKKTLDMIFDVTSKVLGAIDSLATEIHAREMERIQAEYEETIRTIDAEYQAKLDAMDSTNEFRDELNSMDEEDRQAKLDSLAAERDAAIAAGDDVLAKEKQREIDRMNLQKQAADEDKRIADEKDAIEKDRAEKQKKADQDVAIKKWEYEVQAFGIMKAIKIAEAIASTASAVAATILVPPAAIAAGIAGAVQVGIIASQQPPPKPKFAMGGTLGGSPVEDVTTFLGTRGETIINTKQGQNLFDSLSRSGLLSGNTTNMNTTNQNNNGRTYAFYGPVTIQGDGEFADSVNRRLAAGGNFT